MKKNILNLEGAKLLNKEEQREINGGTMYNPNGNNHSGGGGGSSSGGSNCNMTSCTPGKCYDTVYCRCKAAYPGSGNGIC